MAFLLVLGCGAAPTPPPATERPVPTLDMQALRFSLPPPVLGDASVAAVQAKLESALVAAGYTIAPATAPSDIQIVVTTRTEVEASAFQVSVNGQPSGRQHVQVVIALFARGTLIDRLTGEYRAPPGTVDDGALTALADALTRSRRLKEFAEQVTAKQLADAEAQKRADEARQQAAVDAQNRAAAAQAQATAQQARRDEDAAWYRIRVEECRVPRSAQACDLVRAFLAKYPDGPHAAEAKAALDAASPKLEAIQKDEAAWAQVEPDACRRREKDACARVDVYLAKFPAGLHAATARELVGGSP